MEKTLLILKPDVFDRGLEDVLVDELKAKGLRIETSKELFVDMEVMKALLSHYHEVIDRMGKDFNFVGKLFNSFYFMGSRKILLMVVTYDGSDIIDYTRTLIGKTEPCSADPASIRGKYSQDSYQKANEEIRLLNNLIHASDSYESVERELNIWQSYLES